VLFTRAKLLDKVGEFGKAFEDLVKANEIKSTTRGNAYLENKDRDRLLKYRKVFSKENIENFPASINNEIESQITPVFIVGFPRSGTSLLEQILTSHSMISAGGELVFINEIKNQIGSLTGSDLDYPENLIDTQHPVTAEIITQLQHMYIQRVQDNNIVEPGNTFFTDKLPHNLTNLGLISLLFPKSPIIHITRHPMDASLSAFMANFDRGHNYTSSIKNIVTHYALLMQTVEQYKMVLDMRYLQVRYEDLVEDLSTVSQNILDFIGLPWEEACLKFNESKRVVKTASHAQVTEKIYTTSRYRYKNYYKQLEPYAGILQEAMDNFGYSFEP